MKKKRPFSFACLLRRMAQGAHAARDGADRLASLFRTREAAAPLAHSSALPYGTREEKGRYVYDKYKKILNNASILDVGGDRGYLQRHLPAGSSYYNIGFGEGVSLEYNLEGVPYPFADNAYDVVL